MMVWQDMFDPYVNSREYYGQSGDTSNSWVGLNSTGLVIANWDHSDANVTGKHMTESIRFFGETLGMQQLLCGYCKRPACTSHWYR